MSSFIDFNTLFFFETRATQTRLGSTTDATFWTVHSPVKLGEIWTNCLTKFYVLDPCMLPNLWCAFVKRVALLSVRLEVQWK